MFRISCRGLFLYHVVLIRQLAASQVFQAAKTNDIAGLQVINGFFWNHMPKSRPGLIDKRSFLLSPDLSCHARAC